jgi:prevent-host-death family protein
MTSIDAYEAKTHFSKLLDKVTKGDRITITKHGVPVAVLQPVERSRKEPATAIKKIKNFRKGNTLGGISIKSFIKTGRR